MLEDCRELLEEAWHREGVWGLLRLELRLGQDFLASLCGQWSGETARPWGRAVLGWTGVYVLLLVSAVGLLGWIFSPLYAVPAFHAPGNVGPWDERWIIAYLEAQEGVYGLYRRVLQVLGVAAALGLGSCAALVSLWRDSVRSGLLALLGGTALTLSVLSWLPVVYFPFDRYPVAAAWVFQGMPLVAGLSGGCLAFLGKRLSKSRTLRSRQP